MISQILSKKLNEDVVSHIMSYIDVCLCEKCKRPLQLIPLNEKNNAQFWYCQNCEYYYLAHSKCHKISKLPKFDRTEDHKNGMCFDDPIQMKKLEYQMRNEYKECGLKFCKFLGSDFLFNYGNNSFVFRDKDGNESIETDESKITKETYKNKLGYFIGDKDYKFMDSNQVYNGHNGGFSCHWFCENCKEIIVDDDDVCFMERY